MTVTGAMILATAAVTLATAIVSLIVAVRGARAVKASAAAIQEIHISINSRMDELLKLTASASRAQGVKEEKERPS